MVMIPAQFTGVGIADHVVGKDRRTHSSEGCAPVLQLRSQPPLLCVGGVPGVTVRAEDRRNAFLLPGREIEIAAQEKTRCGFERHVFHSVALVVALRMTEWVQWCFLRERVKSRTFEDTGTHFRSAFGP